MIWLLPVNRWAASNAPFVVLFVGWLYVVYFTYRYYAVPRLLRDRRQIAAAIAVIVVTLVATWFISRYRFEIPRQAMPPNASPALCSGRIRCNTPRRSDDPSSEGRLVSLRRRRGIQFRGGHACGSLSSDRRTAGCGARAKKAELALYKVQINPHFLFNTLNTLYGLMLTDVARAETAFMQFMELTKYMYTNAEKGQSTPSGRDRLYPSVHRVAEKSHERPHRSPSLDREPQRTP